MDLRPLHLPLGIAVRATSLAGVVYLTTIFRGRNGRGGGSALEERRRIARELHDGLAQELAFLVTQAKLLGRTYPEMEELPRLEAAAQRALDETRIAIAGLTANGTATLADAVEAAAEEIAHREGVRVQLDLDRDVDAAPEVRDALVRIVREAATNAIRHGRAQTLEVRLQSGDGIRLDVSDDGIGFVPDAARRPGRFGLVSMSDRARCLGGALEIESRPGRGTRVGVTIP